MSQRKRCRLCEEGFPLKGNYHLPSQRKGMIQRTPCEKRKERVGPTLQALGIEKVGGEYVFRRADGVIEILRGRR